MSVSKRLRYEVLRRDKHTCQLCGASAPDVLLEIDHVIPRQQGGQDIAENLQVLCEDCNAGKGATWPEKWQVTETKRVAKDWRRGVGQGPAEDDLTEMYTYMDAWYDLERLPVEQVLMCITHVMAGVFPIRPDGSHLIRAAAVLARDGYGALSAEARS